LTKGHNRSKEASLIDFLMQRKIAVKVQIRGGPKARLFCCPHESAPEGFGDMQRKTRASTPKTQASPPPELSVLRAETEAAVAALITAALTTQGYALVRVQLAGARGGLTLQLMAERMDGMAMLVEDCQAITAAVDPLLDAADPIPGAYALEVSSPGIDRPLTRPQDFVNWVGHQAKITLQEPQDGRKNFVGTLGGLQDDVVTLTIEGAAVKLPLQAITKAQLVLTDALIAATAAKEAAAAGKEMPPLASKPAPNTKKKR
jgi:ribosome maturation factor RimP